MWDKTTVFNKGTEISFGSNYREVRGTEGLRNRDSTAVINNNYVTTQEYAYYKSLSAMQC